MRARLIGVALTIMTLTMTAHADAVFIPGMNAPGPFEVIAIGTQSAGSGGFISGSVHGTNVGSVSVIATSTRDTLVGGSNRITSGSGPLACNGNPCLHEVDLTWPGFGFPFVVINPFRPVNQNGTDLIVTVDLCTQETTPTGVVCVKRTEQTYPPPGTLYGTGNSNTLTITTINNETITEVKIESNGGFQYVDQIRAGSTNVGAGIPPEGVIPEPSSMLLLGSGLLLVTQVLRRKLKHGLGTRSA